MVAVDEKTSLHDARKILEAHRIRRLPVMRKDKLVGLVTERMLLEASPSSATALSIHELHYLLAKMTVKDIMVKKPYTISPDMPVEEALQLGIAIAIILHFLARRRDRRNEFSKAAAIFRSAFIKEQRLLDPHSFANRVGKSTHDILKSAINRHEKARIRFRPYLSKWERIRLDRA